MTFELPAAPVIHSPSGTPDAADHAVPPSPCCADVAPVVRRLLRALPAGDRACQHTKAARAALHRAETELGLGHLPLPRLREAIGALARAQDIALRAPEAAHHVHALATMLGLTG